MGSAVQPAGKLTEYLCISLTKNRNIVTLARLSPRQFLLPAKSQIDTVNALSYAIRALAFFLNNLCPMKKRRPADRDRFDDIYIGYYFLHDAILAILFQRSNGSKLCPNVWSMLAIYMLHMYMYIAVIVT